LCVPDAEHCGGSPFLMLPGHGPSVHFASLPATMHCSPPRVQSTTARMPLFQHSMARPSTSQKPTTPLVPRPWHASGFAPCSTHARRLAHELACRPHSRIVSEKLIAAGDASSSVNFLTHDWKSAGIMLGGSGSFSH